MKKLFTSLLIFIALSAGVSLFSADAEITYVKGKVEVQRGNEWVALKPGDKIAKNEMISTGFQSEAKVKLLDSIMSLGPVTRITLEELTAGKTQDKVNVYLKTGSVRSQVNHAESKRVNYQVHTAIAVASARGTDYSMFSTGETVVASGIVGVAAYVPPASDSVETSSLDEAENEEQTEAAASADSVAETTSTDSASSESAASEPAAPEQKVVLVKANQSAKVSSTGSVSAPVSKAVQSVNAVVQAVSTAASKESVSSSAASAAVSSAVTAATSSPVVNTPVVEAPVEKVDDVKTPTTGFVEITVSIE